MQLGQLTAKNNGPVVPQRLCDIRQSVQYTVRTFIGDDRCSLADQTAKHFDTLSSFGRKKANEPKGVGRQAGSGQGSQDRGCTGEGHNRYLLLDRSRDQTVPGI